MRGRDSSNAVRSTAPSAAARACASDTALRAASASLRMLNAKPLASTVSSTVSHSASTSAMPDCALRRSRDRRAIVAMLIRARAALAARDVPRAASGFGRLARLDVERRPRRALLRRDVDADQQRQPLRVVPLVAP